MIGFQARRCKQQSCGGCTAQAKELGEVYCMAPRFIKKLLTSSTLMAALLMTSVSGVAQDAAPAGGEDDIFKDSMRDIYVVTGAGLGGAILGLSTLSFVDEPGDHLKNIVIGGSIGIIIGVAVVAYSQATKSQNLYNEGAAPGASLEFNSNERLVWHKQNHQSLMPKTELALQAINFNFSF
jgi:hypothetical protein